MRGRNFTALSTRQVPLKLAFLLIFRMDAMLKYLGHRLIVKHDEGGGGVFAPSPGTNLNIITEYY